MSRRLRTLSLLAIAFLFTAASWMAAHEPKPHAAAAVQWSAWRGHDGRGVWTGDVPLRWSRTENIAWQADVPGRGHGSPVLWNDRVFVVSADADRQEQMLLCFDRASGKELWRRVVHQGGFMKLHKKNSHASATPLCDGERVVVVFINHDALWVTAFDLQGKQLWQTNVGRFTSEHGYGSSPVLYKELIIVNGDNLEDCFVAALDRKNGKTAWRTPRPTSGKHGSYATPAVATIAGRPQLLLPGMSTTFSYDPATGKELWRCPGPAEVMANTPAWNDQLVFTSGGYPEKEIFALRADGQGDVSGSHLLWRTKQFVAYVPSPIWHEGRLYVVADNGIASCFEGQTNRVIWQQRLGGNFSASPLVAGGHIFVSNEAGVTYVYKPGDRFELVAENDLGDGGFASLAFAPGQIFLRSENHLFCIGQPNR